MSSLLRKIFGTSNDREIRRIAPIVEEIKLQEQRLKALSDIELRGLTATLKTRHENGESLDDLLTDSFALVREASVRTLGMRHYDVQMIGGAVLHSGKIAEMKTGEGKTLCATLPVYLNALSGQGVHVVTVNDYLARRDAEWMGKIYNFLGMSVGVVTVGSDYRERKEAYSCDITYGQNNEFGFDYLRDNMKLELEEMVQPVHNFAIVDEVDSILIDEARTPLIISGASRELFNEYQEADRLVRRLKPEIDYSEDLKHRQVTLTEEGVKKVEELLRIDNLYDPIHIEKVHHLNQALRAHVVMKSDVDYVVKDNQVVIVDEFTGRLMPGRRWSDGLHQAIEAKEGVTIAAESQTLATITFQNFFRMYNKLAGMTGTADTEAAEFKKIYNLDVVIIPTNMPMIRDDFQDVVYPGKRGKLDAILSEIVELNGRGQPVLVGTANIEQSEIISARWRREGVQHNVLNAKHHEREAEIVAQAGRVKAVTISTNMAGRGTDILLGGNPEFLAASEAGTKDPEDPIFQEALTHYRGVCKAEREQVLASGGLHILGTERHESRRIDNQLRGRSGRQGDPGSSRFYISLEDDLMKRFGGEKMQAIMMRVGVKEHEAIEGKLVTRAIENAQKKVEGMHFDTRKHLLEYDDVMNKHREVIYTLRSKIIRAEEINADILEMIGDVIEHLILIRAEDRQSPDSWDLEGIFREFNSIFGESLSFDNFRTEHPHYGQEIAQILFEHLQGIALRKRQERQAQWGNDLIGRFERWVYLTAIDFHWKEHLVNMDHLKEGIGLRGYNQRNPLHEYQREALELFKEMLISIKITVLQNDYNQQFMTDEEVAERERLAIEAQRKRDAQARAIHQDASAASAKETTPENLGNRANRRRLEAQDKNKERHPPRAAEVPTYAPTEAPLSEAVRVKKADARKKNKDARKARKQARK